MVYWPTLIDNRHIRHEVFVGNEHWIVDPMPGACDFCQINSVCRIADRGAGAPEALTDE